MHLTADAPVFKRAERLTPIPFTKHPLPEGWRIPEPEPLPVAEDSASVPPEVPSVSQSVPEPVAEEEVSDDFGAQLGLPPEPPRESGPA